jgi:hypothetical protein
MKQGILARISVPCVMLLTLISVVDIARADLDRDATPEEEAKVLEVLKAESCVYAEEVDYIQGVGFEADDVVCTDGKVYDIFLDENLNITSKREDRD